VRYRIGHGAASKDRGRSLPAGAAKILLARDQPFVDEDVSDRAQVRVISWIGPRESTLAGRLRFLLALEQLDAITCGLQLSKRLTQLCLALLQGAAR